MTTDQPFESAGRVPVGISACLMGQAVRYDADDKLSRLCRDQLSHCLRLVEVCPEVEIGLGVPREPIRLVDTTRHIEVQPHSTNSIDHGPDLAALVDTKAAELDELCGFILMEKSPSCGLFGVKVHDAEGNVLRHDGRGAFAAALTQRYPELPVEEAGRLADAQIREDFIARVFNYR